MNIVGNQKMKRAIALLMGAFLLLGAALVSTAWVGTAIAHEEPIKKAIGFIHLQDFHADRPTHRSKSGDIDTTHIRRGVLLYKETFRAPTLTAFEYVQLKSTRIGNIRNPMAYVFDQKLDWYQLGTDERQYLWVKEIDTSGFISFKDVLNEGCFYLDITSTVGDNPIKVSEEFNGELVPVRTWTDVVEQYNFGVKELREIEGELWINLSPHWYEPWHSKTTLKKEDHVFNASRWTVAHDVNGLSALSIVSIDCS